MLLEAYDPAAVHMGYVGDRVPICSWTVEPTIVHEIADVTCKLCVTRYSEQIEAEREPERCTYDWPGMEGPVECGGLVAPGAKCCERHAPYMGELIEWRDGAGWPGVFIGWRGEVPLFRIETIDLGLDDTYELYTPNLFRSVMREECPEGRKGAVRSVHGSLEDAEIAAMGWMTMFMIRTGFGRTPRELQELRAADAPGWHSTAREARTQ